MVGGEVGVSYSGSPSLTTVLCAAVCFEQQRIYCLLVPGFNFDTVSLLTFWVG